MRPRVSVIIPNYNGKAYLDNCIRSLMNQTVKRFEIIIVDDCSKDGAIEEIKNKYLNISDGPVVRIIENKVNSGFCKSVNIGILMARAAYVILLNNDTEADPNMVRNLYRTIRKDDRIFSVGAKMISLHDQSLLDDAGDLYCSLGWAFSPAKDKNTRRYTRPAKIFAACGGAAIYRKDLFKKLGGLDERHFAYLEDIDIGYRAKLGGYVNLYEPAAVVYHAGSASSGSRHNEFKVFLSSRNNIYLLYKNTPLWQLVFNGPLLLAGILIKLIFFARKGLAGTYLKGTKQGLADCMSGKLKNSRLDFSGISLKTQILLELELTFNTFRRLLG